LQIGFVFHVPLRSQGTQRLALFFQLGLNHEEHEEPRRIVNRQRQSLLVSCSPDTHNLILRYPDLLYSVFCILYSLFYLFKIILIYWLKVKGILA